MDRIRAFESMTLSEAVGVGTGSFKKGDAAAITRAWSRRAKPADPTPASLESRLKAAAMAGIEVVEEKS